MKNQNSLTKKQLSVIDEMFAGQLSEDELCEKHSLPRIRYHKWLADERFKTEFTRRIDWLNLQSQALIARYASFAAAKLVELIDSDKEETRRKACLDIISLPRDSAQKQPFQAKSDQQTREEIPPETASKILEALANQ